MAAVAEGAKTAMCVLFVTRSLMKSYINVLDDDDVPYFKLGPDVLTFFWAYEPPAICIR